MDAPEKIEIIGDFLALRWKDGKESIFDSPILRANSPSAEQTGESDIFGKVSGGSAQQEFCEYTSKILNILEIMPYAFFQRWSRIRHLLMGLPV